MIEVEVFIQCICQVLLGCMKFDVDQSRGVVCPLQESTQAQEVKSFVLQHGARCHAT